MADRSATIPPAHAGNAERSAPGNGAARSASSAFAAPRPLDRRGRLGDTGLAMDDMTPTLLHGVPPKVKAPKAYGDRLHRLQVELVNLQRAIVKQDLRVCVLIEGRDAAGKDGMIRRIVRHMAPRVVKSVALGKPTETERHQWYFQRYAAHLPTSSEMVLFNRSWYNRGVVEPVMGFCSPAQADAFLEDAPKFEAMIQRGGLKLFKYWIEVSREEQAKRLENRREDPLRQWKISPVDDAAQAHYDAFTRARDRMLAATDHPHGRWLIVNGNNKKAARLNLIADLLSRLTYPEKDDDALSVDPTIVMPYRA